MRQEGKSKREAEGIRGTGFLVCEREGGSEKEKKASKHT